MGVRISGGERIAAGADAFRPAGVGGGAAQTLVNVMELDTDKIDDAVLALLLLGESGGRAWKGFDWEAMNRLHERGYISNPKSKALSIVFTDEGLARARKLLEELFGRTT
jgi:hypothetical protein